MSNTLNNASEQLRRFEKIDQEVSRLRTSYQQDEVKLGYDKAALKEKMVALQEKGLSFSNVSDVEGVVADLVSRLDDALTATERKIREAGL